MNITRKPPEIEVKALLASVELPIEDISTEHMEHYFGAWTNSTLEGVVGVELHGSVALLRSLAVVSSKRRAGLGARLLVEVEQYAAEKGIQSIFLLTTTAEAYFTKRGYSALSRTAAPDAIRNTTEFAKICPLDSTLMVKRLPAITSLKQTRGAATLAD